MIIDIINNNRYVPLILAIVFIVIGWIRFVPQKQTRGYEAETAPKKTMTALDST